MTEEEKFTALAAMSTGAQVAALVPKSLEEIWRFAQLLAKSGMVPTDFRGKPEACAVAILQGLEVGLSPIAAIQSIAVINGRPCLWGDGMLAVVRASGLLESIEEIEDNGTAICRVKRRGQPVVERRFSDADAKRAGLSEKAGPWQQYRPRMRQFRARSWCLRDTFADVLKGMSSAEEMRDVTPDGAAPTAPPPPAPPPVEEAQILGSVSAWATGSVDPGRFLERLGEAMASASSLDDLHELWECNRPAAEDAGVVSLAQELFDMHESRIERLG